LAKEQVIPLFKTIKTIAGYNHINAVGAVTAFDNASEAGR
jgi:hypothetical protein